MLNRIAALPFADRVGQPTTVLPFSDERGWRRQSVAGIGRKRVSFELWDSAELRDWPVPRPHTQSHLLVEAELCNDLQTPSKIIFVESDFAG
jgi:hypothetical protein